MPPAKTIVLDPEDRDALAARRYAIGASVQAVALAAGVHRGTIESWEAGRTTPTEPNLRAWHYALIQLEDGMMEYLTDWFNTGRPEPKGRTWRR